MAPNRNDVLEAQVRAARERGEFDHLPGHGKPLALDDLDHLRPEQRFEALLMRSAGEVLGSVSLVREIRACRALILSSESEPEREAARVAIGLKVAELQALLKSDR